MITYNTYITIWRSDNDKFSNINFILLNLTESYKYHFLHTKSNSLSDFQGKMMPYFFQYVVSSFYTIHVLQINLYTYIIRSYYCSYCYFN